jgi:hypothetical protein
MEYSSIEAFDVRAEAFRRMTGMMAPGKDESALGASGHSDEERRAAFDAWYKQHGDCVRAVMKATESVCQRDGDDS